MRPIRLPASAATGSHDRLLQFGDVMGERDPYGQAQQVVYPRQVAMDPVEEPTEASLPEIDG